ncbi:uncharacterized protein LAESUDRAFT_721581 [Laetiporus sulphureus 93-53]|uniref:Jacalin-type lectin domain-containing protein n=1 Tax=Laetiporus sulphureus 93-53 TaxID=1314785 RepID=A0A165GEP9_9APHY|nr:uncharacterized protein LAESUDRAFT_721581 [Laetiporus sulphureus 93-53]KZT10246.1 hypothetical protein LAESUDRAFT_721581 [Laetiporus sulphureus 93-53]
MGTYIQSSVIGGCDGTYFNDLHELTDKDGQLMLDLNHPITRIEISSGWLVDGLKVTYKLRHPGLSNITLTHGKFYEPNMSAFDLKESEMILAIYGRAGYQDVYKQKLVNRMSFVIFDQHTGDTRVLGPFGSKPKFANFFNGSTYHVANVMAFAGYDNGGNVQKNSMQMESPVCLSARTSQAN